MNPADYGRVKDIFFRACEVDPEQLDAFLHDACGGDQAMLQEVRSLLEYRDNDTISRGLSDTYMAASPSEGHAIESIDWVGRAIGKYQVLKALESGGMGVVLEAYDAAIDRRVAVKVLHAELAHDDAMRKRFYTEARAAGAINHPNVVTLYDVGEQSDQHYLVMEFASDGSAADLIDRVGPLATEWATDIMLQASRGVAAAHAAGLVHRDLKPANLLLTSDGVVKVSDFGIAKIVNSNAQRLTMEGQIVGTPNYMSPEQCQGEEIDARTDVYALGATYYTLLTGPMPFFDREGLVSLINAHCNADPPDPRGLVAELPDYCAAIIRRAMAKRPEDRYQSVGELIADLASRGAGPPKAASNKPRTRPMMLAAVATAAALVLGGFWWWGTGALPGRDANGPDAAAAFADASSIRVGVLHSVTGTMANSEQAIIDACVLALGEINQSGGLLGQRVEPVIADGRSDDGVFAAEAQRLIEQQEVRVIFGCCTSSSRKAVKQVVEQEDHLLVYSVNHEGIENSPNIVYLGGDPHQTVIPCVRYAYGFAGKRRFFLVGSDYVYPRVVGEMVKDELRSMGAQIVGEAYLPLGEVDVSGVVADIVEADPDAVINTISGDTQTAFVRVLRQRGSKATLFSTGMGEHELRNMRASELEGDYGVSTYFQSLESEASHEFVQAFQQRFGAQRVVNASMEAAYTGVHLWAQAVREVGQTDPAVVLAAMLDQQVQAPSGAVRVDPDTHYAHRRAYIGQVQSDGSFTTVWASPRPLAPQPYPPSRPPAEWDQLLNDLRDRWGGAWSAPTGDQ